MNHPVSRFFRSLKRAHAKRYSHGYDLPRMSLRTRGDSFFTMLIRIPRNVIEQPFQYFNILYYLAVVLYFYRPLNGPPENGHSRPSLML